jgi:hypothetical protein
MGQRCFVEAGASSQQFGSPVTVFSVIKVYKLKGAYVSMAGVKC